MILDSKGKNIFLLPFGIALHFYYIIGISGLLFSGVNSSILKNTLKCFDSKLLIYFISTSFCLLFVTRLVGMISDSYGIHRALKTCVISSFFMSFLMFFSLRTSYFSENLIKYIYIAQLFFATFILILSSFALKKELVTRSNYRIAIVSVFTAFSAVYVYFACKFNNYNEVNFPLFLVVCLSSFSFIFLTENNKKITIKHYHVSKYEKMVWFAFGASLVACFGSIKFCVNKLSNHYFVIDRYFNLLIDSHYCKYILSLIFVLCLYFCRKVNTNKSHKLGAYGCIITNLAVYFAPIEHANFLILFMFNLLFIILFIFQSAITIYNYQVFKKNLSSCLSWIIFGFITFRFLKILLKDFLNFASYTDDIVISFLGIQIYIFAANIIKSEKLPSFSFNMSNKDISFKCWNSCPKLSFGNINFK